MRCLWGILPFFLVACGFSGAHIDKKDVAMFDGDVDESLGFDCRHEKIPPAPNESDVVFQYARWLQKNNDLRRSHDVDVEVERLYRISAEHAHYKANINLQNGAMRGRFKLRAEEHLRLSEDLIKAEVATGYLFIAYFLQQGSAGLRADPEMALRFYRKAADSGNAHAQYVVAEKLAPIDIAPDIARQMRRCAAEQGHGDAAVALSVHLQYKAEYGEALEVLQMGVASGNEHAAGYLDDGFRGPDPKNSLDYLGLQTDLERAERYNRIWRVLSRYSYADPVVPEINEIVPLPPAKLPPWDGKLQWLEARLANIPPEKPSEALIRRLAGDKLLDPISGRPLPASSNFIKADRSSFAICNSGDLCPRGGYWKLAGMNNGGWGGRVKPEICLFREGERFPTRVVPIRYSRTWPLPDRITREEESVKWQFYGDA